MVIFLLLREFVTSATPELLSKSSHPIPHSWIGLSMQDNLDKPNRLSVRHVDVHKPLTQGKEHKELHDIAKYIAMRGCTNVYVLQHVVRMIADTRAPGLFSNNSVQKIVSAAYRHALCDLRKPPKPWKPMRVKVTTTIIPSEQQLKDARNGKPIVTERTIEMPVRRHK